MPYKLAIFIASGLGSGLVPKAPGTIGTLAAVLCWYGLGILFQDYYLIFNLSFLILVTLAGFLSTSMVLKKSAIKDPQFIVIDEWSGMAISLLSISSNQPYAIIIAFLLFRFFDITKLGPISKVEQYPKAAGVMLDDILAGIASLFIILSLQTLKFL